MLQLHQDVLLTAGMAFMREKDYGQWNWKGKLLLLPVLAPE
jgi:hypothetical protein